MLPRRLKLAEQKTQIATHNDDVSRGDFLKNAFLIHSKQPEMTFANLSRTPLKRP